MAVDQVETTKEDGITTEVDLHLVARIVDSYIRHHKIGAEQLAGLIAEVRRTIGGLGHAVPLPEEPPKPAVSVKRSVQRDHVVCLECGLRAKQLRHHLAARHGLDPAAYRARWELSADYPLVVPSYSERRSVLAKQIRLGRPAAAPSTPPQRRRRRARPRRSQSAA